jgi:hypothetical protein
LLDFIYELLVSSRRELLEIFWNLVLHLPEIHEQPHAGLLERRQPVGVRFSSTFSVQISPFMLAEL